MIGQMFPKQWINFKMNCHSTATHPAILQIRNMGLIHKQTNKNNTQNLTFCVIVQNAFVQMSINGKSIHKKIEKREVLKISQRADFPNQFIDYLLKHEKIEYKIKLEILSILMTQNHNFSLIKKIFEEEKEVYQVQTMVQPSITRAKVLELAFKIIEKNEKGNINFVLLEDIGKPVMDCKVPDETLNNACAYYLNFR